MVYNTLLCNWKLHFILKGPAVSSELMNRDTPTPKKVLKYIYKFIKAELTQLIRRCLLSLRSCKDEFRNPHADKCLEITASKTC